MTITLTVFQAIAILASLTMFYWGYRIAGGQGPFDFISPLIAVILWIIPIIFWIAYFIGRASK